VSDYRTVSPHPQVPPPPAEDVGGQARVPWSWLDAVGVLLLSGVLYFFGLSLLFAVISSELVTTAVSLVSLGVVTATSVVLYIRARYPGRVRAVMGPRHGSGKELAVGLGFGLLGFVAVNWVFSLLLQAVASGLGFELPEVQQGLREALAKSSLAPAVIVAAVLVAPVAEELFFRGMLFQALRDRLGVWPGIVLSGVIFGAVHFEPVAIVSIAPLGIFLGWLFHWRGTLLAPMAAHALFNLIGVGLMVAVGG
jgi:membrane protease YdiL (CAAX protease family)